MRSGGREKGIEDSGRLKMMGMTRLKRGRGGGSRERSGGKGGILLGFMRNKGGGGVGSAMCVGAGLARYAFCPVFAV